jgi:hypothetical protein
MNIVPYPKVSAEQVKCRLCSFRYAKFIDDVFMPNSCNSCIMFNSSSWGERSRFMYACYSPVSLGLSKIYNRTMQYPRVLRVEYTGDKLHLTVAFMDNKTDTEAVKLFQRMEDFSKKLCVVCSELDTATNGTVEYRASLKCPSVYCFKHYEEVQYLERFFVPVSRGFSFS